MLKPEIVKKLIKILGKENVFTTKEDLICYSYDSTPHDHLPDIVVAPANTQEIVAIIKLANEHNFPVVPRGGGTNLSGGTVPIQGGLVLALHRMNKIIEIDTDNLTATVEPGVITATFHQTVEKEGLFYPPDPQSMFMSTMGGNVAENAGGPRGVKYGVTKDYVLGVEAVTPTGEVVKVGGKTIKNVSGYDLIRLFAGSEGTLGVITQITLKLIPKPEAKRTILAIFDHLDDAAKTVSGIIKQRIIPTTLELMDQKTMELIEGYIPSGLPTDAEGALLIEADGSAIDVDRQIGVIEQMCKTCGAREVKVAQDATQEAQLWAGRRSAFGAMARSARQVLAEDATVPRSKVPDIVRSIQQIAAKYQLTVPTLGHTGDGNMHPNILVMKQDEEEMKRVDAAIDEMFKAALDLGGTLSGEHGIGLSKQKYMKWQFDKASLDMMKAIKKAVDPNNILNPGKIFLKDE
ncbi:FAD-binding protein [Desulfosporosinus sp. HMP52]|uniref:FAD-binding oxidoreductase n=1 Tax=Desulfosporosinus sp. HMP52 TaxID=1487923 RepID=UPI00051F9DFA|nr:FAD-linked oxidase C-terminal domain-containing protein [Desulfosporosinus sp. HMP52]KGK82250.1 FAD-binding protein [Desulfosporosinus sp. HMP52]